MTKTLEKPKGYQFVDEGRKHLHTLGERPLRGTSTITDIIAKNLVWWSAELSAVECLESGEKIETIRQEYTEAASLPFPHKKKAIDALCEKYPIFRKARFAHFERKNETASDGTDLHAELEKYVKGCLALGGAPIEYETEHKAVKVFSEWAVANVEKFLWSEGHCYSEELWVGGISDCGAVLKDGKVAIIDFKSAKDAFFNHFVQVGGYAVQIEENGILTKDGEKVMELSAPIEALIIVPFGNGEVVPAVRYNVSDYKRHFTAALDLYVGNDTFN